MFPWFPSAFRDVCNGESTFYVGVKCCEHCEQSIPGGGRGTDDKCKGFCCPFHALRRHLLWKVLLPRFFFQEAQAVDSCDIPL